jgi:hypothetical protein
MAKVPINDPKHWRERAEEARTVADDTNDPDSKSKMLRIAENYEELAFCDARGGGLTPAVLGPPNIHAPKPTAKNKINTAMDATAKL